jgi:hypothetical protein
LSPNTEAGLRNAGYKTGRGASLHLAAFPKVVKEDSKNMEIQKDLHCGAISVPH